MICESPLKSYARYLLTSIRTGFGTHADYVFGWKGDALQRVLDSPCYVNCPTLLTQTVEEANNCSKAATVSELIDGCKLA